MPQEEELRQLQAEVAGIDPRHELDFAGETWRLREDGDLVALLRYACLRQMPGRKHEDELDDQALFSALYRVLSECIPGDDWEAFERAAYLGRVSGADIGNAVRRIVEVLTARPFPAAIKLLAGVGSDIGTIDGTLLLSHGSGLSSMTARQVCNLIYAKMVQQFEDEAERDAWISDLNSDEDPQRTALNLALEMIERKKKEAAAAGIELPEPEPASPPEAPWKPPPEGIEDEFTVTWD